MGSEIRNTRRIPRGLFAAFVRQHPTIMQRCTDGKIFATSNLRYVAILRFYMEAVRTYCIKHPVVLENHDPHHCHGGAIAAPEGHRCHGASESAIVEHTSADMSLWTKYRYKRNRTGSQYMPAAANRVCDSKRRRVAGGGRHHRCIPFREAYTMWWSIIRHSIDTTVMCRVPVTFFLMKAKHMYQEYLVLCVNAGEDPEPIDVGMRWVWAWLREHRLTSRMPNRKYKVAR